MTNHLNALGRSGRSPDRTRSRANTQGEQTLHFIPSLELSLVLYEEQIAPLMASKFPDVQYAAATYGMCSETFGLDDEVSMDHEWGPRVTLILSERDHDRCSQEMLAAFRDNFPARFKGFDTMWRQPGVDVHDTRETILYHVWTTTVDGVLALLRRYIKTDQTISPLQGIGDSRGLHPRQGLNHAGIP